MALDKKKTIPAIDISAQINSMNSETTNVTAGSVGQSRLRDIPEPLSTRATYAVPVEPVSVAKPKKVDNNTIIGFKIQKEAKAEYQEFFAQYGLNLSEASKNALEYFIQDLKKEKVRITLTHHFERVEE